MARPIAQVIFFPINQQNSKHMKKFLYGLLQKAAGLTVDIATFGTLSDYRKARLLYEIKVVVKRQVKDWILITAGVFSASFGLKGFLLPNDFIDGGAVGIALLCGELTQQPLWMLLVVVNTPFMVLAWRTMGRGFALKTATAIGLLALVTAFVHFPVITQEKLLVAVFGGFFVGAGIGLAVRGGSVIDGTEVLALEVGKRTGMTIGDVIMLVNIAIFGAAAWLLSVETALYSLLAYMAAARSVDFIVEGVEEYIGVTIISPKSDEIKHNIVEHLQRGVTVYAGKKGMGRSGPRYDLDILFVVITRLEIGRLKVQIDKTDPHAFVVMQSVKDIKGGMIKRRPLKH
jgi:uncharacterized membrane-anchored protein YitT (DUF2179 family)